MSDEADDVIQKAAAVCKKWQKSGFDTIAVICRDQKSAARAAQELKKYVAIMESDLEEAEFGNGILVFPVEYTKGLEFDAVLILNPTREAYPVEDGHAKLLYVAVTRALHELCVLHTGNLTGLIADPVPERAGELEKAAARPRVKINDRMTAQTGEKQELMIREGPQFRRSIVRQFLPDQ